MNFRALLTVTAIVAAIAGLGLIVNPGGMQQPFGMTAEQATASSSIARLLGAYMVSFAIVFWAMRGISSDEATASLAKAVSATFVIGTGVMLMLQMNNAIGKLGWGMVALYAIFALAYAYIGFGKKASAT